MSFLYASPTMRDWNVAASQLQRGSTPAYAHTMTMKTSMSSVEGQGGRVIAKLSPGVAGTRGEKDVASSHTRHTWPAGVCCRTVPHSPSSIAQASASNRRSSPPIGCARH